MCDEAKAAADSPAAELAALKDWAEQHDRAVTWLTDLASVVAEARASIPHVGPCPRELLPPQDSVLAVDLAPTIPRAAEICRELTGVSDELAGQFALKASRIRHTVKRLEGLGKEVGDE